MREEIQTKREQLKAISKIMQQLVKENKFPTVNAALVAYYADHGHTEIHSFKKWLEQGYCVKRGEKALLLWGEPRKGQNHEKKDENDKDEFSFFPLAYVFSQLQVEPLKKLENAN